MRPRNQTQSVKNSSNAVSPEIASCIWARFTQKNYLSEYNKNGERGTGDNKNGGDEKTAE